MASSSGRSLVNAFLRAASDGDLEQLKRMKSKMESEGGAEKQSFSDMKNFKQQTALHCAASGGNTHICNYLVTELKLDINARDRQSMTPLQLAISGDHSRTAAYLVNDCAADINAVNILGQTALHLAAEEGNTNLMQLLISKGADVDAKSGFGTPLFDAASHSKKEAVRILLNNNANPNIVPHGMFSPLMAAVSQNSPDSIKLLLEAGADPNYKSCTKTSPLGIAILRGEEILQLLLKAGANPNATDDFGLTPLEAAAIKTDNDENLKILFPVTPRISAIQDWSLGGVKKHCRSKETETQIKVKAKELFSFYKVEGNNAFKKGDYYSSIYWYTAAIEADPCDASVLSNRSLCFACLKQGTLAFADALACQTIKPDWPKAYYRMGVAGCLQDKFKEAATIFLHGLSLDPQNRELQSALREAMEACRQNEDEGT